jgi:hypothetical protein
MDIKSIIIILAIILIILVVLNYINYMKLNNQTSSSSSSQQGNCSQTVYGCCPDGVNSKINFYGTNCPGYLPPPGYPLTPRIPPPPN